MAAAAAAAATGNSCSLRRSDLDAAGVGWWGGGGGLKGGGHHVVAVYLHNRSSLASVANCTQHMTLILHPSLCHSLHGQLEPGAVPRPAGQAPQLHHPAHQVGSLACCRSKPAAQHCGSCLWSYAHARRPPAASLPRRSLYAGGWALTTQRRCQWSALPTRRPGRGAEGWLRPLRRCNAHCIACHAFVPMKRLPTCLPLAACCLPAHCCPLASAAHLPCLTCVSGYYLPLQRRDCEGAVWAARGPGEACSAALADNENLR